MKLTLILASLAAIFVLGCSAEASVPTPTVSSEIDLQSRDIPDGNTRYTDASESFMISYPQYWELSLSAMEQLDENIRELMQESSGLASTLFFAVLEENGVVDRSTRVTLDLLNRELTTDQYSEVALSLFRQQFAGVTILDQRSVSAGARSSRIVTMEGDLAAFGGKGRFRNVVLITTSPNIPGGWMVTCSMLLPASESELEECEQIVDEFFVLD